MSKPGVFMWFWRQHPCALAEVSVFTLLRQREPVRCVLEEQIQTRHGLESEFQGLEKGGRCVSSIINGPYKGLITRKLHLMDCAETGGSRGCWTSGVVKTHTHTHVHKHITCARGASYHQAVGSVKGSL